METKKIIESIVEKKFKDLSEEETYIYDKAIWKQEHVTNFGNYENQIEYIKGVSILILMDLPFLSYNHNELFCLE